MLQALPPLTDLKFSLDHLRQRADVAEPSYPLQTSSEYVDQPLWLSWGVMCQHGKVMSCDLLGYWVRMWWWGWGCPMSGPDFLCTNHFSVGVLEKVTSLCSACVRPSSGQMGLSDVVPTTLQWSQVRWILILEINPECWERGRCFGTEVQKVTWGWGEGSGIQVIWQSNYLQPEVRKSRLLGCTSATHEVKEKRRRGSSIQGEESGLRQRERRLEKNVFSSSVVVWSASVK